VNSPTQVAAEQPSTVIARLDDGDLLVDAMATSAEGAGAVVRPALRPAHGEGPARRLHGLPRRTGLGRLTRPNATCTLLSVEQSNSSVMVDGRLIAKLVRRLEPGANPDVELPDHLNARGFGRPRVWRRTLEVDLVGEPFPADVVIVHDAIPRERPVDQGARRRRPDDRPACRVRLR
jgi:hypothetical protein